MGWAGVKAILVMGKLGVGGRQIIFLGRFWVGYGPAGLREVATWRLLFCMIRERESRNFIYFSVFSQPDFCPRFLCKSQLWFAVLGMKKIGYVSSDRCGNPLPFRTRVYWFKFVCHNKHFKVNFWWMLSLRWRSSNQISWERPFSPVEGFSCFF